MAVETLEINLGSAETVVLRLFEEKIMVVKNKILKGAEELFMRFGIRGITMDDIAKHLGMSKKTIYQTYADKDEIVHTLMKHTLDENSKVFTTIQRTSKNVIDEVFLCMEQMHVMFSNRNPVMFYDLQKYYPNTWKLFREFKNDFILKMVENTLKKGIKDGLVREDINVNILARLRIEEIELGFDQFAFPPEKFNVTDTQIEMAEHFLYGICTLKGYRLINKYKKVRAK